MVGFGTESAEQTHIQILAAGALAGLTTRAICQPLDVVKIRLQLQVEPICARSKKSKYKSIRQAARVIFNEEGVRAYWKGHVPAQFLSITYGLVQFSSFELLNRHWFYAVGEEYMTLGNFTCGAMAGGLATLTSFPFDFARTRLVAQAPRPDGALPYSGVSNVLLLTYRHEGFRALFRGLLPTVLQVAPHTGIQFMIYRLLDEVMLGVNVDGWSRSLVCGGAAGLVAKTVVYPFDLMRKRLQIQGMLRREGMFGREFICDGLIDCARQVIEKEGAKSMFKGLNASLLKAVVASALHFGSYEIFTSLARDEE